jgi:hypothetical protein
MEQRGLEGVPLSVPRGFTLAPVEPLSFPIGGRLVRVTFADVARHAAPHGPVAGAVVLSTVHAEAKHSVPPRGDRWPRLFAWRPSSFFLRDGEALELTAYKHGTVRVVPFVGDGIEIHLSRDDPADPATFYADPMETLPPLFGKLCSRGPAA